MSGMLIAEYILRERTKTGTMPENPALVETIVTTDMAKAVAKEYNTALIEVLTCLMRQEAITTYSDLRRATAVWQEPMQEIKMRRLQ